MISRRSSASKRSSLDKEVFLQPVGCIALKQLLGC